MSYDLNFWRYQPGTQMDHRAVYEKLCDGDRVQGLEDLPIDAIKARIVETFSQEWRQLDQNSWEGESASFQVYTTSQLFRVDCYGVSADDMNKIIDVLAEFDCPLYDPQVDRRFDGF